MRKWRKTSSFEIRRAKIAVHEVVKAVKKRVVRVAVAAKGRAARTREAISEGAARAKAGQAIVALRAMGARLEVFRAATATFAAIAGFAVRALAAMSN